MKRKPYWAAVPGIIIGIVFLIVGFQFFPPLINGFTDAPLVGKAFPFIWVGIVLVSTIRNIRLLFTGPSQNVGKGYQGGGYIKDESPGTADRLRELDYMRQDGTITPEEYETKKKEILEKL